MSEKTELLTTAEVAAHAAKLSMASIVSYCQDSCFPVVESLKPMLDAEYLKSVSPSSAIAAAAGASSAEKRVFVPLAHPAAAGVKEIAAMRLPAVIFTAAHPEQVMSLRDAGCAVVFCASHQELLDTIIRAFRLCEDSKILIPCVIAWNSSLGYAEPVLLPSEQMVRNFLPALKLPQRLETKNPSHLDPGEGYAQARQQQGKVMENFLKLAPLLDDSWKKKFKRSWPAVDSHQTEDAELVLVTYGYHAPTARVVVDALRAAGKKVGLVRLRIYRPFPLAQLAFLKEKKVAVLDFASAPGSHSPLYQDIRPLAKFALSFISLEKYLSEKDFLEIFSKLEKAEKEETFWL